MQFSGCNQLSSYLPVGDVVRVEVAEGREDLADVVRRLDLVEALRGLVNDAVEELAARAELLGGPLMTNA